MNLYQLPWLGTWNLPSEIQDAEHGLQTVPTTWFSRFWTEAAKWQWGPSQTQASKVTWGEWALPQCMWCQQSRWDIRHHALAQPWAKSRNSEGGPQRWIELWNNRPAVPWRNNPWDFSVLSPLAHPFCMFIIPVSHLYWAPPGHHLSGLFVCLVWLFVFLLILLIQA